MDTRIYRIMAAASAMLLITASASCSGQGAPALLESEPAPVAQTSDAPAQTGLGAPRDLIAGLSRETSAVPYEWTQFGKEYDANLPNAFVSPNILALDMGAQGPLAGIDNCSYAVYNFNAPTFSENLVVRALFNFGFEPQAGDFYIGVANWDENRWDWKEASSGSANFGSPTHYKLDGAGDGTILIALMMPSGATQLAQLSIGADTYPRAMIATNPAGTSFQMNTNITFLAALFGGGTATKYEWDFDDDGIYEETDSFEGTQQGFTMPGDYKIRLRITRDDQMVDVDELTITIFDPQA